MIAAYLATAVEGGLRDDFGPRFIVSSAAAGVTIAVLASLPALLSRCPGVTSLIVLGTFVAFVAVSAALSPLGPGWGIFLAAIGPVAAVTIYVVVGDLSGDPGHAATADGEDIERARSTPPAQAIEGRDELPSDPATDEPGAGGRESDQRPIGPAREVFRPDPRRTP